MPYKQNIIQLLSSVRIEIVTFFIALFTPTIAGLMFLGFLIFVDTLTGVWKSQKIGGWGSVKSKVFSKGIVPKLTMYPLILLISSGCEINFPEIPFIKGAIFLLMCIELKSLVENFNVILKINLFTYIKAFITKGRKGLIEEVMEIKKANESDQ